MSVTALPPACHSLIEENIGLVHACCHKLSGRGIEYEELFAAGSLGLCKAAGGFDPALGYRFSTYAVPVILGEMRRLFREGGSVKVSRSIKELGLAIRRIQPRLRDQLNREPTVQELASTLSVPPEQVTEALCADRAPLSLSGAGTENGWDIPVPDQGDAVCDKQALYECLATLSHQDRTLIELRYFEGNTQMVTAQKLGMTQVQVSRKERAILKQLRAGLL